MAGETGELVDVIAKCLYKPGFGESEKARLRTIEELGDCWFYYRVLAAMAQMRSITKETLPAYANSGLTGCIGYMYYTAATIHLAVVKAPDTRNKEEILYVIGHKLPGYYTCLERIAIRQLRISIDTLTEANWEKLRGNGNGYLVDKVPET